MFKTGLARSIERTLSNTQLGGTVEVVLEGTKSNQKPLGPLAFRTVGRPVRAVRQRDSAFRTHAILYKLDSLS